MNLRAVQTPSEEGLRGQNGGRAQTTALDREALIGALSALASACRRPFDEELLTGQLLPPYGFVSIIPGADLLGLCAVWVRRPASALRKLTAPLLILLLREPHHGYDAGPVSLASLGSAAPNQRLAFLLRFQSDRVGLIGQGAARHTRTRHRQRPSDRCPRNPGSLRSVQLYGAPCAAPRHVTHLQ